MLRLYDRFGGPIGGWFGERRAHGDEGDEFAFGAIEGALEAAFLTAELIEGARVGEVSGGLCE